MKIQYCSDVESVFLLSDSYMGVLVILVRTMILKRPNSSCLNYKWKNYDLVLDTGHWTMDTLMSCTIGRCLYIQISASIFINIFNMLSVNCTSAIIVHKYVREGVQKYPFTHPPAPDIIRQQYKNYILNA